LKEVSHDEKWHIAWIKNKLDELAKEEEGGIAKAEAAMDKYREIDRQVYEGLLEKEREVFGGQLAHTS